MADTPPPNFDQLLASLRQIVEKLESGALGLEESLRAFEEGVALSRQGASLLDAAEQRVEILLRDPTPGSEGASASSGGSAAASGVVVKPFRADPGA